MSEKINFAKNIPFLQWLCLKKSVFMLSGKQRKEIKCWRRWFVRLLENEKIRIYGISLQYAFSH